MKCSACQENACEGKFENKYKCLGAKEKINCTCCCQVSKTDAIRTSVLSIGAGVAAAAGGVALTMMTGGLFAVISGAALVGAGSSMVMTPIQKKIAGERMTLKDSVTDIALGATIGAITGPIGSGASSFAKGASGLVKFGVRAGAGAAAGAVSGTVGETARYMKGEEVSGVSFAKSIAIGAVAGTVGGASTHVSSNLSKGVANEVGKAVTRVSVQAASAAATDAGLQLYDKGEIDTKQLLLTTAGQITVATTAEVSQNVSKRTDTYNKKINSELTRENIDKDGNKISQAKLLAGAEEINSMRSEDIQENKQKASDYNTQMKLKLQELKTHQETLAKISGDPSLSARQKLENKQEYCKSNKLPSSKTSKHINREINSTSKQAQSKLGYIGEKNVHALKGERTGQFAVDLAPADPKTGHRSGERGIYEIRDRKAVYVDHTADHNYDGCRKDISKLIPDPYDALRPEHINQDRIDDEENKSREKTE